MAAVSADEIGHGVWTWELAKQLERRLPLAVVANSEVFIVVHPDLKDAARVRVVLDQIVALFERDVRSLSGLG